MPLIIVPVLPSVLPYETTLVFVRPSVLPNIAAVRLVSVRPKVLPKNAGSNAAVVERPRVFPRVALCARAFEGPRGDDRGVVLGRLWGKTRCNGTSVAARSVEKAGDVDRMLWRLQDRSRARMTT